MVAALPRRENPRRAEDVPGLTSLTMTDAKTMVRSTLTLGDDPFRLAQDQDLEDLQHRIATAIKDGGGFVTFVVVGNRTVSLFMTGRERIALTVETVPYDSRDTGDTDTPWGGLFDGGHDGRSAIDGI